MLYFQWSSTLEKTLQCVVLCGRHGELCVLLLFQKRHYKIKPLEMESHYLTTLIGSHIGYLLHSVKNDCDYDLD